MSTGAVFKLLVNDGKADRMILATKLLYQRIQDIMYARSRQGRDDITPTLIDLERTHIVYINAHFKPFAAIGYEYNKVRPNSGNSTFGSSVQFSIPQFGDFFHDMVCRVRIGAVYAATQSTPLQTGAVNGAFVFPYSSAASPAALAAYGASGTYYNIVDAFGTRLVAGVTAQSSATVVYRNFVRYAEFPGNRLFNNVKFDVNGNPLDTYDYWVPVMLEKNTVFPHKRDGYNRLVGQQVPLQGVSGVKQCTVWDNDVSTSTTVAPGWNQLGVTYKGAANYANTPRSTWFNSQPSSISRFTTNQSNQTIAPVMPGTQGVAVTIAVGNTWDQASSRPYSLVLQTANVAPTSLNFDTYAAPTVAGTGSANYLLQDASQMDLSQQLVQYTNGPQTPKIYQPPLEIWNKLRFWFNDDVRLSIPSVSIPYGQRFITIDITTTNNLIFEVPSIYVETVQVRWASATDAGEIHTFNPLIQYGGFTDPQIMACELYINNIFVNPEVHDIFIRRIGFALIRVYREQKTMIPGGTSSSQTLLSALKWPVEFMFAGLMPTFNGTVSTASSGLLSGGNPNMWRDWHRFSRQVDTTDTSTNTSLTSVGTLGCSYAPVAYNTYWQTVSTIDQLGLKAHGISIYDDSYLDTFYNQYATFHYGESKLVTPNDTGVMFINMSLFPRSYQPSGHINISRARETYIDINSTYLVSSSVSAALIVVAICINFLLVSDGSAVLRYST